MAHDARRHQRFRRPGVTAVALLAAAVLSVILAWPTCPPPKIMIRAGRPGDTPLYASEVERVRKGESYYVAAGEELRNWGYPTRPFLAWRLPTLTYILALLPSERWAWAILVGLVLATVLSWCLLVLHDSGPPSAIAAGALVFGGMVVGTAQSGVYLHEVWAGVLVALSLALHGLGFARLAIVLGVSATLIRELALPYLLVMGLCAVRAGNRRELAGWAAGVGLVTFALFVHALLVQAQASVEVRSGSWLALGGACFVLSTAQWHVLAVATTSPRLLALAVPLSLVGLAAWPGPTGSRLLAVVLTYLTAFLFIGRSDNNYWGFVYSPLLYLGLAMLPRLARDTWVRSRRVKSPTHAGV